MEVDSLKKSVRLVSLICSAALLLSSCTIIDHTFSGESEPPGQHAVTPSTPSVNTSPHSHSQSPTRISGYGRSLLNGDMLTAYDRLSHCAFRKESTVEIPLISSLELTKVMTYIRRDFPELSYLADEYLYRNEPQNFQMTITLKYDETSRPVDESPEELEMAAAKFLANISTELSDFDKAVIVHDRLLLQATYDMDAPRANLLSGALIDGRASCDGYAKAYQYLLQSLGIETLIVYGEAGGPHAWNIVRLDGDYYLAEFLFLDDTRFSQTHTPSLDGVNYPLPSCKNMEQNYFTKTGTLLTSTDGHQAMEVISRAVDYAAAAQSSAIQIRIEPASLYSEIETSLLNTGILDQFVREKVGRKDAVATGRTVSEDGSVLTYLIKYMD